MNTTIRSRWSFAKRLHMCQCERAVVGVLVEQIGVRIQLNVCCT